jgi:hypothetical protein
MVTLTRARAVVDDPRTDSGHIEHLYRFTQDAHV